MKTDQKKLTTEYHDFGMQRIVYDSLFEQNAKKQRSDRLFLFLLSVAVILMTVIILLNTFVFFNVRVSGPSMQPTLYTGNVLVANRYKRVNYESIIIISGEKAGSNDWLIKRVIGLPGDEIEFINGYVYRNGEQLEEDYILEQGKTVDDESKFKIPEGEIFYLGDNRENSSDSRHYGTCTFKQVVGVVEEWSMKYKNYSR
jgi:signal peptidase I